MRRQVIDIRTTSAAEPEVIYPLLRDGASWPTWSPIDSFELDRAGDGEPEGVGAIRVFRRGRVVGRDEITSLAPDRRFSYRHLSGLPVRDYHADVDLTPIPGGGTAIAWHASFLPSLPGTGWIYRWGIGRMLRQSAVGLAGHAAPHSAGTPGQQSADDPA